MPEGRWLVPRKLRGRARVSVSPLDLPTALEYEQPMTADDFRRLALSLPGATESAHMRHPDFRVGKRVFATLGYPDETRGMVKLTPEQQSVVIKKAPRVFSRANGAWGAAGSTLVLLAAATKRVLYPALKKAWQHALGWGKERAPHKVSKVRGSRARETIDESPKDFL